MSSLPLTIPDAVCDPDVDPYGRETTSDLQSLIQDVTHVLKELPGSNPDDPDRGVGVDLYLGATAATLNSLCGLIEAQLNVDDRIQSTSATVELQEDDTYRIKLDIEVGGEIIPLLFGWQAGNFTNLSGAA